MAKKTIKKDMVTCKGCGKEFDRNESKRIYGDQLDARMCSAQCYTAYTLGRKEKWLAIVVFSDEDLMTTRTFFSDEKSFEIGEEFRSRAIGMINEEHRAVFSDEEVAEIEVDNQTIGMVSQDSDYLVLWYRQSWLNEGFRTMPVDAEEIGA